MANPDIAPPVQLALLGAGIFASSIHKTALLALEDAGRVQINLVWSRSRDRAQTLAREYGPDVPFAFFDTSGPHQSAIESARAALRRHHGDLDAVVIALPVPDQAPFAQMALEERMHVLQEKPLAENTSSAHAVLLQARKSKLVYGVAENFRFEPIFRLINAHIDDVCGTVISIRLSMATPMRKGTKYGRGWRLHMPGVGILLDGIVHHIAGMRATLASDVARVCATCHRRGDVFDGCDTVSASLQFANGVPGTIDATYVGSTFFWQMRLVGEKGDIVAERNQEKPGYKMWFVKPPPAPPISGLKELPFTGIEAEFEAFIDSCIIERVYPDLDAHLAFNDMAAVLAMYESSQTRKWVSVADVGTGHSAKRVPANTSS